MGITVFQSSAMSGMSVTSKTRPANPPVGLTIYETDTMMDRRWDGTYWEIVRWYGQAAQGRAAAGPSPNCSRANGSFTIANDQWIDVNSWTTTNMPSGAMATASTSGGALFTTDGSYIYTQEKGRVRVACHGFCDNGAAHRADLVMVAPANGLLGGMTDTRVTPSGFPGAGSEEIWLTTVLDCLPGDKFGLGVHGYSNPPSSQPYSVQIQVSYL